MKNEIGKDKNIMMTVERKKELFFLSCFVCTYLFCYRRGQAKPNETVLIHGASGGVSLN